MLFSSTAVLFFHKQAGGRRARGKDAVMFAVGELQLGVDSNHFLFSNFL